MSAPNILLVMTDEERSPPPDESDAVTSFRKSQLIARESLRSRGVEFHRHSAETPSAIRQPEVRLRLPLRARTW
jgi:arylsulfatase A-like enzyme